MTASGAGRRRRTVICALPLLGFVMAGALAPVIAPYDPIANDLMASLARPSVEHLLGTDQLGRDQLSRLLYGAQASLILAAAVLAVSVTVGVVIGTAGGFLGGWPDRVALWLMDVTLTLPSLIVALAILGAEYVLGWLPRGTHQMAKFLTPEEVAGMLAPLGFVPEAPVGVVYHPLTGGWHTGRDTSVNYMLAAAKA